MSPSFFSGHGLLLLALAPLVVLVGLVLVGGFGSDGVDADGDNGRMDSELLDEVRKYEHLVVGLDDFGEYGQSDGKKCWDEIDVCSFEEGLDVGMLSLFLSALLFLSPTPLLSRIHLLLLLLVGTFFAFSLFLSLVRYLSWIGRESYDSLHYPENLANLSSENLATQELLGAKGDEASFQGEVMVQPKIDPLKVVEEMLG